MHWTDERTDEKMDAIDRTFEMIRDELEGLRTDVRAEIGGMRIEMREEIGGMRSEMREEIGGLRTEMREEIGGLRTEMRGEMVALRSDFNSLQRQLIQIGFGMIGVMVAAFTALIVAVA